MNRRTVLIGASALGLVAFGGGAFVVNTRRQADADARAAAAPPVDAALLDRPYSPSFGPADAPVTLVEFFDPSCEACRAFYPHVKKILVENPSDVRLVLRYVLFHQGSEEVTRMLEAARKQNLYPQVLEAVLAAQPGWHDDPKVAAAWVAAEGAGLDVEKARADMHTPGVDAVLETDMQDVKTVGIRGTPTFFVNGRALSEFGPEPLRDLVRSEVAKARN